MAKATTSRPLGAAKRTPMPFHNSPSCAGDCAQEVITPAPRPAPGSAIHVLCVAAAKAVAAHSPRATKTISTGKSSRIFWARATRSSSVNLFRSPAQPRSNVSTCTDAGAVVVGGDDGVAVSVGEVGGGDEVGGDGVAVSVGEVGGGDEVGGVGVAISVGDVGGVGEVGGVV